ncbi:unnamed protein product [Caenorhabditis sp. 36 PRJEB53466]|nr:unnamed protein product [Caenorhabditis sp. 36 PRJEB53466]
MAACNVNGVTIHTAFRLNFATPHDSLFNPLTKEEKMKTASRIKNAKYVFIDEISMVSSILLARIDHTLQQTREVCEPFGGLSVIAFGDLYQLSPVCDPPVYEALPTKMMKSWTAASPANKIPSWSLFHMIELEKNYRNEHWKQLEVLKFFRWGIWRIDDESYLRELCAFTFETEKDAFDQLDELQTKNPHKTFLILAAKNDTVNRLNRYKLNQLGGVLEIAPVINRNGGNKSDEAEEKATKLQLAVGCRVMITRNMNFSTGIINGTIGVFLGIEKNMLMMKTGKYGMIAVPRVGYVDNGVRWNQFPIVAAEAITVHKAQGLTVDGVVVICNSFWNKCGGMLYTAISRARNLALCRISGLNEKHWDTPDQAATCLEEMARRNKILRF